MRVNPYLYGYTHNTAVDFTAEAGPRGQPAKAVMRHQGCSEGFPEGRRPKGNPEEQPWWQITVKAEGYRVPAEAL